MESQVIRTVPPKKIWPLYLIIVGAIEGLTFIITIIGCLHIHDISIYEWPGRLGPSIVLYLTLLSSSISIFICTMVGFIIYINKFYKYSNKVSKIIMAIFSSIVLSYRYIGS